MVEDQFGQRVPEVVDLGKLVEIDKLGAEGLFLHPDFAQGLNPCDKAVAPANLVPFKYLVAADVLAIAELSSTLFSGLADSSLKGSFSWFNAAAWYAPATALNIAYQHFAALPRKN